MARITCSLLASVPGRGGGGRRESTRVRGATDSIMPKHSPDWTVATLALEDRFGDNGVVGLAVIRTGPTEWLLHMFLMSCRVLGRTVEQAFVGWIAERAKAAGVERLVAEFVPTSKNRPFADFYKNRGLVEAEPKGGVQRWVWNLRDADTAPPDWLAISVVQEGGA